MENKKISSQEQSFSMLSVPSRKPFVVSKEKATSFINDTNSKKENEFVKQMAETFIENNLVDGTVLKKTKKLSNK